MIRKIIKYINVTNSGVNNLSFYFLPKYRQEKENDFSR